MAAKKRGATKDAKSSAGPEAQAVDDAPAKPDSKDELNDDDETNDTQVDEKPQENKANKDPKNETKKSSNKKRKAEPTAESSSNKTSRRSARGSSKGQPSRSQLYNFLLSKEAEDLSRPQDEQDARKEHPNLKTYSSSIFTPFEELLSALLLSRPISHRLGHRSIRTLLSPPYTFTTPRAIIDAGEEKRHQALWDARTQHKAKTAEQIGAMAEVVLEKFTGEGDEEGVELTKVLDDSDGDVDAALAVLKGSVKGLGETGLSIFLRRVQWVETWRGAFPFVDGKTRIALKELGLPGEAEELRRDLEMHWEEFEVESVAGKDEEERKRRAFVVVLERVVGAELEGRLLSLREKAAEA